MQDRPFAFVCSPFRGDMEANAEKARTYSRQVYEAGYSPLAPHLLFPQFIREDVPAEREAGIGMGIALLAQCRMLVVCGERITEGMAKEIQQAERLGIPVHTLDALPNKAQEKPSILAAALTRPPKQPRERPAGHAALER